MANKTTKDDIGAKHKQIMITLEDVAQHKRLKRQALKWVRQVKKATGVNIPESRAVSAYVRYLIEQDR